MIESNQHAIALLRRMQEPEAYEPQITAAAFEALGMAIEALRQADHIAEVSKMDCISKQAAIDKFIDGLEEIFADLRERHVDDSVCGLCEYDGAYIGQSGDWCNECPGFEKDDCFKLSSKIRKEWTDEIIKAVPSAQPETAKRIVGKSRDGMTLWYQCDMCNEPVDAQDNFCRGCGRRLTDE